MKSNINWDCNFYKMIVTKQNTEAQESSANLPSYIKNVWKYNVEKEFQRLGETIDAGYCWIAMDTEFPGIVFSPAPSDRTPELAHLTLKANVDNLKLIQVGVCLSNERGEKPAGVHTWQFNLAFDLRVEKSHPESIKLLKEAGISFETLAEHGIDHMVFADLLMTSGLAANSDLVWLAFHGAYDFAYLLRALTNSPLPRVAEDLARHLHHLFPNVYDVKTIVGEVEEWRNHSLSRLGAELRLKRAGLQHQAGSDALLTSDVFFGLLRSHFPNGLPEKYYNKVFGISGGQDRELIMPSLYHMPHFFQDYQMYSEPVYQQMGGYFYPVQQMPEQFFGNVWNVNQRY